MSWWQLAMGLTTAENTERKFWLRCDVYQTSLGLTEDLRGTHGNYEYDKTSPAQNHKGN